MLYYAMLNICFIIFVFRNLNTDNNVLLLTYKLSN